MTSRTLHSTTRFACALLLASVSCQRAGVESGSAPETSALTSTAVRAATVPSATVARPPRTQSEPVAWLGTRVVADESGRGALVAEVVRGTPAALAGVTAGDVIAGIAEREIQRPEDVNDALGAREIGVPFELRFRRGATERSARVALEPMPGVDELARLRFLDQPAPSLETLRPPPGAAPPRGGWLGKRATVIEFWASWCGTCQVLAGTLNRWHERFGKSGIRIIGVTRESPEVALPAAQRLIEYPLAFDQDSTLSQAWDVRSLPMVFVIDHEGKVRDVMRGLEPERLAAIEKFLESHVE